MSFEGSLLHPEVQRHVAENMDISRIAKPTLGSPMKYRVLVDDNFHYMDESERYELGQFDTLEAAVAACKIVVDEFLVSTYRPGMTVAELLEQYAFFGEDPYVFTGEGGVPFSARDYASERVRAICGVK